ncbi:MAG: tetratricopeptide repeat protein [Verrucomicrobia bacterium]|nr:tetratricopeptide repeat protein [Verrucomicrobiota bacterium]
MNTLSPICLLLGWLCLVGRASAGETDLAAVWEYLADSQSVAARAALKELKTADPRTRALADVVLTMARPPVAEGRLPELETTLNSLASGDGDTAALALYLRARLHQVHLLRPNYARAATLYRELARHYPRSHWAQLGLVKLGIVTLYALPEPADPAARFAAVSGLLEGIGEPALRRDLQLQIGWAGLFYDRPLDEVLPHLIAADRVGGLLGITPEELVLQIGELSLRAGHRQQARTYFERFLREFPTNIRRYTVQQRLVEIGTTAGLEPKGGL